jgi:[protein-PII] uridylyltransferase
MRAVGPGVLTPWQAAVLHDLYTRTLARLTGGRAEGPNRPQLTERLHAVVGGEIGREAVQAHVAMTSDRYLATTSVQRMAEHLRLLQGLETQSVVTELFHHPDLNSSGLVVITRDVPGLFSLIAGTLAAHGINIMSAQIHTRADGIAIDTFQVNDPVAESITAGRHWALTIDSLRAVITGDRSVSALLAQRTSAARRGRAEESLQAVLPKIAIDNRLSDASTVLEVKCPDRLGLLYLITRTLSALDLDIASARIATEIDHALDTFYVHTRTGDKIDGPESMSRLREALEQALVQPL